jgi:group I intron endonuclease
LAIIYKIQNKLNNKVYIGQSLYTLDFRLNGKPYGHFYVAFNKNLDNKSSTHLHKALRKYGKDNFIYEVVEEFDNTIENLHNVLNKRERYWIKYYDSCTNGYNQTTGGHNHYHRSEANKKKISERTKEAMSKLDTKKLCNPMKNMTEEQKIAHKKKISERTKEAMQRKDVRDRMLKNHSIAVKKDTYKAAQRASHRGRTPWNKGKKCPLKPESLAKFRAFLSAKKYKWYTNGVDTKMLSHDEATSYVENGWYLGRNYKFKVKKEEVINNYAVD